MIIEITFLIDRREKFRNSQVVENKKIKKEKRIERKKVRFSDFFHPGPGIINQIKTFLRPEIKAVLDHPRNKICKWGRGGEGRGGEVRRDRLGRT